ncbi:hypothetical protein HLB23_26785 [Nocardia uniformis]|uniref:Uncharacterized protein n=1 Tax=Nocardia uniformis TaxID=53432 RepID=A0A849CDY2_9NOCA|nr:hypothetical protein [Nocardia uniformis]NNH73419.1 hypothetical protein [Nocardia uniformis]
MVSSADYDRARAEYASTREQFDAREGPVEFGDDDFSAIGDLDEDRSSARIVDDIGTRAANDHDVADGVTPDGTGRTEASTGPKPEQHQQAAWFESDPADAAKPTPTAPPTPDPKQSPATATTGPRPTAPPAPRPTTPIGTASSRRRRRADDDNDPETGSRLSVAEIMANLRSEGSK